MENFRIAVIGTGLIGREHCTLLRNHPTAELGAIADPAPEAEQLSRRMDVPHYPDYPELLDNERLDGVIIALPNSLHEPAALACIARELPCLVEKPIADTLESALAIAEAGEAAGVPVLVGHHRRHSPDIREARRIIRSGELGGLVAVSGVWLADKPERYFDSRWRREPGGGPILINLIHDIDCLRFIVGEIQSIHALGSNAMRGFQVEDTVSVAIRFANGALGSFLLSDCVASPFTWEVSSKQALYFPHHPVDCYLFGGSKASLAVPSMKIWSHRESTESWQDPFVSEIADLDGTRAYENQLEHFLNVVAGREAPAISARDATLTLAATQAVATSARTDRTIAIEDMLSV